LKRSLIILILFSFLHSKEAIIINHSCTDITQIPEYAIMAAKEQLHIAYGHTSHGSQLTDGMNGLIDFANIGGIGLELPNNIFKWNNGGSRGALDLHNYAMGGWLDCGIYPDWVNETREYLDNPANDDVNIVMWSWCGEVEDKYVAGTIDSEYLEPMAQLEMDYPDVTFVYMTGHVDIDEDADNKAANDYIRSYCNSNNRVLYDFADIDSWNPDGNHFEYVDDNCDYYSTSYELVGNWATEWQNNHIENVDWYTCNSAHSQPLNANQKAYAAWWMFAIFGGWEPPAPNQPPVADAGEDQSVIDNDYNGNESIVLDGSGSYDNDGSIVSYSWIKDDSMIGNGVNPSVNLNVGTHTIILKVIDNSNAIATDTAEIIIAEYPFLITENEIEDIQVEEDAENTGISLAGAFSNPYNEDAEIIYSVQLNNNSLLIYASISGDTLILEYLENQSGIAIIVIDAVSEEKSVADEFIITVLPINDPPVFTNVLPDTTISENKKLVYQYEATDIDSENLIFSLISDVNGLNISNNGKLEWIPTFDQEGDYQIIVSVSDDSLTATDTTHISVKGINRAPQFISVFDDSMNIDENTLLELQFIAEDSDSDNILYSLYESPEFALLNDTSGELSWTPTFEDAGVYSLLIIATDGNLSDTTDPLIITVQNVNRPPIFLNLMSDTTIFEGDEFSFQFSAIDYDEDKLSFSLLDNFIGAILDSTGLFYWLPNFEQTGQHTVIVKVSDFEYSVNDTTLITINNTNRPPSEFSLSLPLSGTEVVISSSNKNDSLSFEWEPSLDPDGDEIIYDFAFYFGNDTLIRGKSVRNIIKYAFSDIYNLMENNDVEGFSGEWNIIATDELIKVKSNSAFELMIKKSQVSIKKDENIITDFKLFQNYPNPFNPSTTIEYSVPEQSFVEILIFDMHGNLKESLVSTIKPAGNYSVSWNLQNQPSGIYFYQMKTKNFIAVKKCLYVK